MVDRIKLLWYSYIIAFNFKKLKKWGEFDLKKISSFLVALAFCTGLTGLCAHAAEKTQDGIKLCISSDKTAYDENDNIVAKISLENI